MREEIIDELILICVIIGRKEELDRVEITPLLKSNEEVSYLQCSPKLKEFISACTVEKLSHLLPRYSLGSESNDKQNMFKLRKVVQNKDLLEILNEKEKDTNLPFEAFKNLCEKFAFPLSDEQCGFICSNFLRKIVEGTVYIDFAAFLGAMKSFKDKAVLRDPSNGPEDKSPMATADAESEKSKTIADSPLRKFLKPRQSMNEEQMLDVAEGCFIKMAELLLTKGKSIRAVFAKFAAPEMFPDRTVLELLSPIGFLEGVKELGIADLQEVEAACLMRVLSKQELDNAIILNELVLIMENFGVPDGDEDGEEDYVPDTDAELSVRGEENKDSEAKPKTKKRTYDVKKVDDKGLKILKKLARYLLRQFLHPREFFGKSITKEKIKTKKREFVIDVMKVKDFYLRIKIASIRKRLTENQSIND